MADADLDRIIAELRRRRELLDQVIAETDATAAEREKLILTTGKIREKLERRSDKEPSKLTEEQL